VNPLLFVYGTLLSSVDHPMSRRLANEGELIDAATFNGRLYRVSWYPGLVDGDAGDVVHGELHRLRDPEHSLTWLDEFEGVARGVTSVTEQDEYARVERAVRSGTGSHVAWVYLYRGSVAALERVATGRWVPTG
jgi:gamma-glutamylcyclotransferase (GGCT)/AIG2-like uncharacterized protein YtfP